MTLTKQVFRMTIQEFKQEATRRGNTYDNSSKASENWSRCWGLGYWWRDLWFYKEYRLGNMIYRTGRVRRRHYSYFVEERLIDGQTVDTRHFNKALKDFQAPSLSSDEQTYSGTVKHEDILPIYTRQAIDGEIFELEGKKCIVIGGAYSVDKFYRLSRGMKWWPDEQPSPEIKEYVEKQLDEKEIDVVFSHTCPAKYIPTECFLSGIDQSKVDNSTEEWLDTIEDKLEYEAW